MCMRQSTELSEEFIVLFFVKVYSDPEVDSPFALENLDIFQRAPCIWHSLPRMRQLTEVWKNFTVSLREGELAS